MADRRIDQLTEAEGIDDEDLFVIWKKNISQTRSIKKGTMNLATKNYVDSLVASRTPDWSNAVSISVAQINAGYNCPNDGVIVGTVWRSTPPDVQILVNSVEVTIATTYGATVRAQLQCPVGQGDVLSANNPIQGSTLKFVPYKTLN